MLHVCVSRCRATVVSEVLPAMKLVKFYCWERFFEERIMQIRRLEQRLLSKGAALKGLNICLVFTVHTSNLHVLSRRA
jgi:ATP-binding cassette, subfamily C (CFTR/MRP), member 1